MADDNLAKASEWAGIAAALLTVGAFAYYFATRNTKTTVTNGVRFTATRQRNRDATLGQAGRQRKFFGVTTGRSSAQGAGTAASLPPRIGRYNSSRLQKNTTRVGVPTNGQVSTNPQTRVSSRRNLSQRASVAAVSSTN